MASVLSDLDQLCFKCPVPGGCNENDARCLRRKALSRANLPGRGRWQRGEPTLTSRVVVALEVDPMMAMQLANRLNATSRQVCGCLYRLQRQGLVLKEGQYTTAVWILAEQL